MPDDPRHAVNRGSFEHLPAEPEHGKPAQSLQEEEDERGKAHPLDICLQLVVHPATPGILYLTEID